MKEVMLKMEMSKIIFDNDCLASFLWTDSFDLLNLTYDAEFKIPFAVYKEFERMKKYPKYSYVFTRLETQIQNGNIEIVEIFENTEEHEVYERIKSEYAAQNNGKVIGEGEAEMLALAIAHNSFCTVSSASNNLRDVAIIVEKEGLNNITTIDILRNAYLKEIKTIEELNKLKTDMEAKKRKLPKGKMEDFL